MSEQMKGQKNLLDSQCLFLHIRRILPKSQSWYADGLQDIAHIANFDTAQNSRMATGSV